MKRRIAVGLAVLQAADLLVSQVSRKFGDAHLDHLGVPQWLRPLLPAIKAVATCALMGSANRDRPRSVVGAALVSYYSAAATFHVLSGDGPLDFAPAMAFGGVAAAII